MTDPLFKMPNNKKKSKKQLKGEVRKIEQPSELDCLKIVTIQSFLYGYKNVNIIYSTDTGDFFTKMDTFEECMKYVVKYKKHINTGGGSFDTYIKNIQERTKKHTDTHAWFYIVDGTKKYNGFNVLFKVDRKIFDESIKEFYNNFLKLFNDTCDINTKNVLGRTPLFEAFLNKNFSICRWLILDRHL